MIYTAMHSFKISGPMVLVRLGYSNLRNTSG